jgi:hypothetical protein
MPICQSLTGEFCLKCQEPICLERKTLSKMKAVHKHTGAKNSKLVDLLNCSSNF